MQTVAKSPLTCLSGARLATIDFFFVFISIGSQAYIYTSILLPVCPTTHLSVHSFTYLPTYLCLSLYLSIYLFINLWIWLSCISIPYWLLINYGSWKLGEERGLLHISESPALLVNTCPGVLGDGVRSVLPHLWEFKLTLEHVDGPKFEFKVCGPPWPQEHSLTSPRKPIWTVIKTFT